jgi:hypothetical protein
MLGLKTSPDARNSKVAPGGPTPLIFKELMDSKSAFARQQAVKTIFLRSSYLLTGAA